ncbi:MAG TPA: GspE/PulE family protein [Syntrophorhabdaceae bacterium]|nr:GspE/PulE family protein [Syntrophorhabdaceae bacterium]HOL06411.1 GspE/PulE family protein [Syntrophorhabdaceae bacterium]HON85936.1 GspE/PulE family protein [Syntrophorhabdaceae bacterium]HOT42424.1 GspE/PulE family protein [Syntrophorhabdaceae bacterium]HPC67249.1 GspE/PulE family protein [Syntrophorhabdaceae bacterium]
MPIKVKKRLGEILIEAKKITEADLQRALSEQKKYGEKLGKVIIKMGLITESEMIKTISRQLGIPVINLDKVTIPGEILRLIPENICKDFMVLPVERRFNVLRLAMADPLDINAMDEVSKVVKLEIEPCITTEGEIKRAMERYFGARSIMHETLERIKDLEAIDETGLVEEVITPAEAVEDEPVIKLVNSIISQAIQDNVSDVHIEPLEKEMRIRMRIDGRLREVPSPQKKLFQSIISRIKILSGMDIAKTRVPQDGRFDIKENMKDVSIRVSTFPTIYGEKVVMRLLDKNSALYGIERLGLLDADRERLLRVLKRPYGFIMATGPTGSGKSTTLYAILATINTPEKNIITLEDPVEYTIEGITQSQINPKAGLTFDTGLRAILRQDPDIIMVGEIRDAETATIATHASLTGHIVLSTFHTNDSAGALTRLVEMGIEPFLVASSVTCVIAQRLLRKICDECKESYYPSKAILESAGIKESVPLYRGRGCPVCRNTGYKGRVGTFEVLTVDDDIRELIVKKVSSEEIKNRAIENGMKTMKDDAIRKAILGITTLEEAMGLSQEG